MFNFCIVLNTAPFYVLAQNEKDLEEILKVYEGKISIVVKAKDLEVMEFKMQMSLFSKNTLLIPTVVEETQDALAKMINASEQDELIYELTNDIN
jgi:primosomal protein N''